MGKARNIPVVLRSKGELTKLMILVEIFKNQPNIKQKDIGEKLGITVQAVSKYFKKLIKDGMIEPHKEKAHYKLTPIAYKKLKEYILEIESYVRNLKRELKLEGVWPAIASHKIRAGERVNLEMHNGILYAVPFDDGTNTASGVAINDAEPGDDVGLIDLKGLIRTEKGKVLIIKLPSINEGGSRVVDIEKVRAFYEEFKPHRIGVMGTVGRVVLNKLGLKADIEFSVSKASAFAALKGLRVFVLAVGKMVNKIIDVLEFTSISYNTNISYEVREVSKL